MIFQVFGFLAVLLSCVYADCPVATSNKCDNDLFKCCGLQLHDNLQLSNCFGILAYEPECHRQEIENLYANGTTGLMTVCDSFNKYYECLGDAREDCTSIGYHVQAGLRLSDAVNVVSMYKQFGFACGAGFEGFSNNDACMGHIFTSKADRIKACRNQFQNNIIVDNANHCAHLEEYTGCFTAVFEQSGCNTESTWWGCEYARQSGRVILHDCNLQCSSRT
ncbi:unnamed protein product [Caenorhabditis angaria]|uniref:DUF19 domain-containing protein n=1 Tax=Caenorhabditis angaria TaxID=860376 RepID=A0A9P1J1J3_9PELO|nr:unnamed protein product [Caenorhabditis angaria]